MRIKIDAKLCTDVRTDSCPDLACLTRLGLEPANQGPVRLTIVQVISP